MSRGVPSRKGAMGHDDLRGQEKCDKESHRVGRNLYAPPPTRPMLPIRKQPQPRLLPGRDFPSAPARGGVPRDSRSAAGGQCPSASPSWPSSDFQASPLQHLPRTPPWRAAELSSPSDNQALTTVPRGSQRTPWPALLLGGPGSCSCPSQGLGWAQPTTQRGGGNRVGRRQP